MHGHTTFGSWLKQRRKALDLTQRALAERVGCAVETVRKIEAGVLRPSRPTAERMLHMLDVPVAERAMLVQLARISPHVQSNIVAASTKEQAALNTLPLTLTSLIGRSDDIKLICEQMLHHDVRLLTLLGPPGIGKTRVGIAVAAELQDDFAHGVCYVALAPINDPHLVIPTISRVLGIKGASNRHSVTALAEALQARHMLLVLDNFEQVVDAAVQITELLKAAPKLFVLITSRVPLRMLGETQWHIPPLTVPPINQHIEVDDLRQFAAAELFVQRAMAVNSSFRIGHANIQAVAELCVRLDGLPLALELAAARSGVLSPSEMLTRLQHTSSALHLLSAGPRDAVARQRTIRDAIAWSFDLLTAAEQRLLARLSVFAGGWTVPAAEAICYDQGEEVGEQSCPTQLIVLDALQSLLDHSLIRQAASANTEGRFIMLEMIREFAVEQLAARGELEMIQQRHADYFLRVAEQLVSGNDPSAVRAADAFDREMDNFRAVIRWSLSSNPRVGLQLSELMHGRLAPLGMHTEGRQWIDALLPLVPKPCIERAGALSAAAYLALRQGDYQSASRFLDESYALALDLNDSQRAARARLYQGMVAHALDDPQAAMECYQACLALYDRDAGNMAITGILRNIADLAYEQHDFNRARDLYQQTLDLARAEHHTHDMAYAIRGLGHVARQIGDSQYAAALYYESLRMFRSIDDHRCIPFCLEALACIASAHDAERAARLLGAAQELRDQIGVTIPPAERGDHNAALAEVRSTLGIARFRNAWNEGQAMTLDEAVAYAFEQAAATIS